MEQSVTILIVEDNQALLEGMADYIEISQDGIGYQTEVLTAGNGVEALALLKTVDTPDLIISDIMMPQMNGYQLLEELRSHEQWARIPIIFLTAKGEREDILVGKTMGVDRYLTKPAKMGELIALVKSQLDMSFRRQLALFKESETFRADLLKTLNHEFRTPLTYVVAYYDILADSINEFSSPEELNEYLKGIQSGCLRLTNLVSDLILVIKLRTGEIKEQFYREVSIIHHLRDLLHGVGQKFTEQAKKNQIEIEYRISATLDPIWGSEPMIKDIVSRLVENSLKFVQLKKEPGKIFIAAVQRQNEIYISVQDTGIGFPDEVKDKIFDVFYQHNRDQYEQQGAGSGLAIVKGVTELHTGRIAVKSRLGIGSQFKIILPVYDGTRVIEDREETEKTEATILVVEDDRFLLEGLCDMLKIMEGDYSFQLLPANNGIHALELLKRYTPNLIISDVMMPKLDGYGFFKEVQNNPKWTAIPFIFLTAKSDPKDILAGQILGVDDYITKPYDSSELIKIVGAKLERHFHLKQLETQGFEQLKANILELLRSDFLTSLMSVTTYSDQLNENLQTAQTSEDLQHTLFNLQNGSSQLSTLIEDFMIMAELRTGEAIKGHKIRVTEITDFHFLLQLARQRYLDRFKNSPIVLTVHPSVKTNKGFSISGDQDNLVQMIQRVIVVLAELIPIAQLPVELSIHQSPQYMQITIQVKGQYLTIQDMGKIRQILEGVEGEKIEFQVQSIYNTQINIVNGVLELHGGRLELDYNHPEGVMFCLNLPINNL